MDRGGIKIVEFGKDDGATDAPRDARPAERVGGIKIKEFDTGRAPRGRTVATPDFVGSIKIIEYDEQTAASAPRRDARSPAMPSPASMKVVDFGKEASSKPAGAARHGGMKIIEFD